MLEDELNQLRRVVGMDGTAQEIDDALLPLVARSDPQIITPILRLLNERGDQDGMWSILHTAESFEGARYISSLLAALPDLRRSCTWWAETLVIRILNSEVDRVELIHQLRDASPLVKEAVSAICRSIDVDERFHAKTAPVLAISAT